MTKSRLFKYALLGIAAALIAHYLIKKEEKPNESKNFDVLKYDGVRALKQHQFDYAVQCFVHALQLKSDDLECRDYLSSLYRFGRLVSGIRAVAAHSRCTS